MKSSLIASLVAVAVMTQAAMVHAQSEPAAAGRKGSSSLGAPGQEEKSDPESLIRQRIQDWAKAIRARDIDAVMSIYAPDIVSFDLNPPLRYAGIELKRRAWQDFFNVYTGPVVYEVRELSITTDGELAFVHSLNHVHGTLAKGGHVTDLWVRWTGCFRRIEGVWRIEHDHVSVPADLAHGRAALNLTP